MTLDNRKQLIHQIEQLAFHTWPAHATHSYSDWKVRVSDGTTKRANSVWTSAGGVLPDHAAWMDEIRHYYSDKGLPSIFQISECSPDSLDAELEMKGFVKEGASTVFIANTKQIIENTRPATKEDHFHYQVQEEHDEIWLSRFLEAEGFGADKTSFYDRLLSSIQPVKGYVSVYKSNQCAALGTFIVEKGWSGIINVVVHPELRGQRIGKALLHQLACCSADKGASNMYLQVVDDNVPANRLYQSAGFRPLYKYHYRRET